MEYYGTLNTKTATHIVALVMRWVIKNQFLPSTKDTFATRVNIKHKETHTSTSTHETASRLHFIATHGLSKSYTSRQDTVCAVYFIWTVGLCSHWTRNLVRSFHAVMPILRTILFRIDIYFIFIYVFGYFFFPFAFLSFFFFLNSTKSPCFGSDYLLVSPINYQYDGKDLQPGWSSH